MDSANYLMSYGWTHGQPLQKGGLRKPILVKHKKDTKGLGHNAGDQEAWWERVFDGQLKGLDVNGGSDGVSFKQNQVKVSGVSQNVSPLYRMFVRGGILEGSIPAEGINSQKSDEGKKEGDDKQKKRKRGDDVDDKKRKSEKKSKKGKSDKKDEKKRKSRSGTSTPVEKEDKKLKKSKKVKSSLAKEEDWVRQLVQSHVKEGLVVA